MKELTEHHKQMSKEVEQFAKTIGKSELIANIQSCESLLNDPSISEDDRNQIKREQAIYARHLNDRLGIFPGSGVGIQKLN